MRILALILTNILILANALTLAQLPSHQIFFQKANQFYELGQYDSAANYYELIISRDISDHQVFYNLGNTYFKMNHVPQAIYCLEKAYRLSPRDKQIEFNLTKARLVLTDKIVHLPRTFIIQWIDQIKNFLNLSELVYLLVATFTIAVALAMIIIYQHFRHSFYVPFFLTLFLLVIEIFWLFERHQYYLHSNQAIITSQETEVRVGPRQEDDPAFIIHAGTKISILQTRNEWVEIKLDNGFTGWIQQNNFKIL